MASVEFLIPAGYAGGVECPTSCPPQSICQDRIDFGYMCFSKTSVKGSCLTYRFS